MIHRISMMTVLALAVAACGGDDGGAEAAGAPVCEEDFEPCGGDPVGTWAFDQTCGTITRNLSLSNTIEACRNLSAHESYGIEGQIAFHADGTSAQDVSVENHLSYDLPVACLEAASLAAPAEACVAVGASLNEQYGGTGGCVWEAEERCRCEFLVTGDVEHASTWTVDGTTLSVADDVEYQYCVQGDYLVRWREALTSRDVHVLVRVAPTAP